MFRGLKSEPVPYPAMWHTTTRQRLELLAQPKDLKIAWLYDTIDTSTFRYRVFNMIENVNANSQAVGTWFYSTEIEALSDRLDDLDTLIICRVRYSLPVITLITRARNKGVRVLFDCDDLVFDERFVHLIMHTLDVEPTNAGFDWWFSYIGRIGAVARLCEGAIVSTPDLADRMRDYLRTDDVSIVPNFLNRAQQETSTRLLEDKRRENFSSDGTITIGYFSGTPSHNRDFAIAAPAIARLMKSDPTLRLRVVGYLDGLGMFEDVKDRLEVMPLQDWIVLQNVIAEVEINIAPLQQNIFTNCKSVLKYFEAAIVGTWTIASPTRPFLSAIPDESMGYIADNHEWEAIILKAIQLFRNGNFSDYLENAARKANEAYRWNGYASHILAAAFK